MFEWVEIARMSSDQTKAETLKFLKELKERVLEEKIEETVKEHIEEKAEENIQALADTKLQILNKKALEKLYESGYNWQETGRKLTELEFVNLHKRMVSFQKLSGSQRYEELYENHQ